jgi:hypothetical protein
MRLKKGDIIFWSGNECLLKSIKAFYLLVIDCDQDNYTYKTVYINKGGQLERKDIVLDETVKLLFEREVYRIL